jgi:hypothetical protein
MTTSEQKSLRRFGRLTARKPGQRFGRPQDCRSYFLTINGFIGLKKTSGFSAHAIMAV